LDKNAGSTGGLGPGQSFVKTWQIKNIGSCTWTQDYALVFTQGDRMSGPEFQKLGVTVKPGQVLEISLVLQAPREPAQYAGYWLLRNEAGVLFGGGSDAFQPFLVQARVVQPATSVYEFIDNLCNAEWFSGSGKLDCPQASSLNYPSGYFVRITNPEFEDGSIDNEPALVMVPDKANGFITGKFPPITVRMGDRFQAVTGCIFDNPECNVSMQFSFTEGGSLLQNLDTWPEIYDGNIQRIDIDLSPLAGKTVKFSLSVYNNGSSINDWVFWLRPRISR